MKLWLNEWMYEWIVDISWRYGGDHEDSRSLIFFYSNDGEAAYRPETPVNFNQTTIISVSLFMR